MLCFKPYILWKKRAHRSEIFRILSDLVKIYQTPHSYLKPQVSFTLNFAPLFSVMRNNSTVLYQLKLYIFGQKGLIKEQNFRLLTAPFVGCI